ncbi:MAG TPA: ABC transporter substrate-binding protein [Candidatus Dormibacteraeota bacterium]|jgi:branched-chain amino acid transport system substrate-binding protein
MHRFTLLAMIVVTAACAGGSAPAAVSSPGAPIKIGLLTSLTGNYAPLGTNDKLAAQQMVDAVNAKGGVAGHHIDLMIEDDQSMPAQTIISYNKLVDAGVVAIEGPPQSTAELALIPIVDQKKVPDVSVGASDDQVIPVHPYVFQTTPLASQVAKACLKQIQSLKFTKLAMLTDTKNAYAIKGHDTTKALVSQFGVNIVADESFETTQTNFATQIARIVVAKPDLLLVWATGAPPVIITKQWGQAKTGIPLMMTAAEASPLYVNPAEPEVEGVYVQVTMGVIGQQVPASNKFKKLIDDFALPFQTANGNWPPQFAWDSMLAMTFIFDAIKRKGTTPDQIQAGLETINLDTPQGHYTYAKDKHFGMPDSTNQMAVVQNKAFAPTPETQAVLANAGTGPSTQT